MKRNLIIQVIFILILNNSASAQWQWAKQIGGPDYNGGGIVLDANSNIYCTGRFDGYTVFGNDTLFAVGANDIFISKYDASGTKQWSKRIGSNNPIGYDEDNGGVAIDNVNSCLYISGRFYNSLTIDGNFINGWGLFLAKFDLSGNCLWLKKGGSFAVTDRASALNVAGDGSVYWTGVLDSNGTVDSSPVNKGTFLAKFNSIGNLLWVKNEIRNGDVSCLKIKGNEMYISGTTRNDTTVVDTIALISHQNPIDAFFAKLDTSGNVLWAKRFGGNSDDYGNPLELDASNNIYIVGQFNDSLFVGNDTLTNNGKYDMFIAKFDNNGNYMWINQSHASGNAGAWAYNIKFDSEGKFYVVGYFSGNTNFGIFNINSSTAQDAFVARYEDTGNCVGIRHFGQAASYNVDVDNGGNVFISGLFAGSINIGTTTLTSLGGYDTFFAKSDAITGIEEGEERFANNQLIIYANPNAGKCNITVPNDFVNEKNLLLRIYDNTGKLIQQKTLQMNDGKIKLNLEQEAKGVYNVVLGNGKKSYNGKIVFE